MTFQAFLPSFVAYDHIVWNPSPPWSMTAFMDDSFVGELSSSFMSYVVQIICIDLAWIP